MAHPIGIRDRLRWRGYLSEHGPASSTRLTAELIRSRCAGLKGKVIAPDSQNMRASIVDVADAGVVIRIPSGERVVTFDEIICAEVVIRYWLAKGMAPVWGDFRQPEIARVPAISNCSYAPALAERIRRQPEEAATGCGNWTEERDRFLGDKTVDELAAEIRGARKSGND